MRPHGRAAAACNDDDGSYSRAARSCGAGAFSRSPARACHALQAYADNYTLSGCNADGGYAPYCGVFHRVPADCDPATGWDGAPVYQLQGSSAGGPVLYTGCCTPCCTASGYSEWIVAEHGCGSSGALVSKEDSGYRSQPSSPDAHCTSAWPCRRSPTRNGRPARIADCAGAPDRRWLTPARPACAARARR